MYSNKDIWPRKGNSGKGVQNAILKSFKEASLVAQVVKNLPAMLETQVQSLGQEDPLEKGMATHSSIVAWRIPWAEEPDGLQSLGSKNQIQLSD